FRWCAKLSATGSSIAMKAPNSTLRFFRQRKRSAAVFSFFATSPLLESIRSRMRHGSSSFLRESFLLVCLLSLFERLTRIGSEIVVDRAQKRLCEIFQFLFADSRDAAELARGRRVVPRHLPQRDIRKNYVGGHIALVGEFPTQHTQLLKQHFVAFDRARAGFLIPTDNFNLFCKCNRCAIAQGFPADFCQRQRCEPSGRAFDKAEPEQLAPDRLPGFALQFAANAVRGQLIVTSLPDRFRIRITKNLDNVIQRKSESTSGLDAMDSGKKFLWRNVSM